MVDRNKFVSSIEDIEQLVLGDRVKVHIRGTGSWMVYEGISEKTANFLVLPQGYNGSDIEMFFKWKFDLKAIEFSEGRIEVTRTSPAIPIYNGTAEYNLAKSIADLALN